MSFTKVSIHAPTGGATTTRCSRRAPSRFQFTRPRGARPKRGVSPRSASSFNSRAHGGRDRAKTHHGPSCVFQFTRPRGARPGEGTGRRTVFVSIHAPTGGATRRRVAGHSLGVFQFTRPRGARPAPKTRRKSPSGFNSRAHGGRDKPWLSVPSPCRSFNSRAHGGRDPAPLVDIGHDGVSIHAPTGGATMAGGNGSPPGCFNSRAHGGRDCLYFIISYR